MFDTPILLLTNLAKVCYTNNMKTINISLTPEQAKYVDKTAKMQGFANRSEFMRAILRKTMSSPFAEAAVIQKAVLTLDEIKKKAVPILKKNDVEFAGIFGSYARGEARPDSDVDFIYRYKTPKSLLDTIGLKNDLSEAFGLKVDLVSEKAIHPYIRDYAFNDLNILYGQRRHL